MGKLIYAFYNNNVYFQRQLLCLLIIRFVWAHLLLRQALIQNVRNAYFAKMLSIA